MMRARCWCFALCENSGVQRMLLWRYVNANCTIMKNTLRGSRVIPYGEVLFT